MPITIELLDSDGKENDITILVGKSLLLKFIPGNSVFSSEKLLQELIKTPNLLSSEFFKTIIKEKELSEEIEKELSSGIKFQETAIKFIEEESFQYIFKERFKKTKEKVIDVNIKIRKIEKETKFYLGKNYPLYFCPNCTSYLSSSIEALPLNCKFCNKKTEEDKQTFITYLDKKIISYLNGYWFEDYIAKILKSIGWKTWCHGSVMGSTGIYHPVDILAINPRNGQVLVGECKSGAFKGKDIFNFAAQYFDVKAPYGFFFALKEKPDPRGKNYMERTPGLCLLDNLESSSDKEIAEKIEIAF